MADNRKYSIPVPASLAAWLAAQGRRQERRISWLIQQALLFARGDIETLPDVPRQPGKRRAGGKLWEGKETSLSFYLPRELRDWLEGQADRTDRSPAWLIQYATKRSRTHIEQFPGMRDPSPASAVLDDAALGRLADLIAQRLDRR